MAGVNKVILVGNLGKEPELKYGQASGKAVCRFSLAVNEKWGSDDRTEWFNIVAFDRTAEVANEYLHKGRPVYIEGRLQTRKYQDQSGEDRYMTEVIVSNLTMLGSKKDNENEHPKPSATSKKGADDDPKKGVDDDPFSGDFGPPPSDENMPF